MRYLYFKFFTIAFLILAINGCKLDTDILPADVIVKPNADGTVPGDGSGTFNGIGLPLGARGTVIYQINDQPPVTLNSLVEFAVYYANDPVYESVYPNGATQITAVNTAVPDNNFSLIFEGTKAGTYNINIVGINTPTVHIGSTGVGTVKVNVLTYSSELIGVLQGSFSGEEVDSDTGVAYQVSGSFNIKE